MAQNIITKTQLVSTTKDTALLDLPTEMAAKFDELSLVRYARMEAEKREKELKAEILDSLPERQKGVKFVLRVAGVIRANVSQRGKTTINPKTLLEAFPEAYEACKSETTFDVLNPA